MDPTLIIKKELSNVSSKLNDVASLLNDTEGKQLPAMVLHNLATLILNLRDRL